MTITRPVLRYHGGKWKISDWIIGHFPEHDVYIDAFGGGASILLQKSPVQLEIYNDLDSNVWNFFKVLQDPKKMADLKHRLEMTPYSRREFDNAYTHTEDLVECAANMVVRCFMGYGNKGCTGRIRTGFSTQGRDKQSANKNFRAEIESWDRYPNVLPAVTNRLKNVLIENCDAAKIIQKYDHPKTLVYADPPYLQSIRRTPRVYKNEMSDGEHVQLLNLLKQCRSMVVLSGYRNDLYDEMLKDWQRVEKLTHTVNALNRVECLWINPSAISRPTLFEFNSLEQKVEVVR